MGKWQGSQLAVRLTFLGVPLAAVAAEAQDELSVLNAGNNSITMHSPTASSNGGSPNA